MQSSHLQSLSRRVKNALAAIHTEIRFEAESLTGDEDVDRRTYGTLSRLQRERKKLEALAVVLKQELKACSREEHAVRVLNKAGIYDIMVQDFTNIPVVVD